MDKEPFIKWDVLSDDEPPFDFLTLLQKSQYNPQLIRTFAERMRRAEPTGWGTQSPARAVI